MITYNKKEIKKAILKTLPVGTAVCLSNWETIKWQMILNDGFKKEDLLTNIFCSLQLVKCGNKVILKDTETP